jgi:hypothetical protein
MEIIEPKEQKEPINELKASEPIKQPLDDNKPTTRQLKGNSTLLKGLQKTTEFIQYIDWLSIPSFKRFPTTQKELAVQLGVSEDTLSEWKNREGFWDEVRSRVKSVWRENLPDAINALYLGLLEKRNASEFTAYMQYVDEWSPKTRVEGDSLYDVGKIEIEVIERKIDDKAEQDTTTEDDKGLQGNLESEVQTGS